MSAPALAIEHLRIVYPREDEPPFVAVDNVSMTIAPGEIHAVVGESGAGKSTVANAIIGLLEKPGRIDQGAIRVGGVALELLGGCLCVARCQCVASGCMCCALCDEGCKASGVAGLC